MRCTFCATGKGGFARNLKAHEIVDQVLTVQEAFGTRVSNVGEPAMHQAAVQQYSPAQQLPTVLSCLFALIHARRANGCMLSASLSLFWCQLELSLTITFLHIYSQMHGFAHPSLPCLQFSWAWGSLS